MGTLKFTSIDELVDYVEDNRISHLKLAAVYGKFLKKLILGKIFGDIDAGYLHCIEKYLDENLIAEANNDEDVRLKVEKELMSLFKNFDKKSDEYQFTECVLMLFVSDYEWDNVAQDYQVFYYLSSIKEMSVDIEADFLEWFAKKILLGDANDII